MAIALDGVLINVDYAIGMHRDTLTELSEDPARAYAQSVDCQQAYESARMSCYSLIEQQFPALHEGNEQLRQVCTSLKAIVFDHDVFQAHWYGCAAPSTLFANIVKYKAAGGMEDIIAAVMKTVPRSCRCSIGWHLAHLQTIRRHFEINKKALADTKTFRDQITM